MPKRLFGERGGEFSDIVALPLDVPLAPLRRGTRAGLFNAIANSALSLTTRSGSSLFTRENR